jgi:hypothetical protein
MKSLSCGAANPGHDAGSSLLLLLLLLLLAKKKFATRCVLALRRPSAADSSTANW